MLCSMNNKDITTITTSGTGDGYGGKFKVLYPAAAVAGKTGSVQLSFTTDVYKYAVFYATCAEVNKYGQLQNYMCDTDPTVTMACLPGRCWRARCLRSTTRRVMWWTPSSPTARTRRFQDAAVVPLYRP